MTRGSQTDLGNINSYGQQTPGVDTLQHIPPRMFADSQSSSSTQSKFKFPASILNESPEIHRQTHADVQPPSHNHTQQATIANQGKQPISRVTRACDRCTQKKLRCDGTIVPDLNGLPPTVIKPCSRCAHAGLGCEYTRVQKRRGPSPGFKRRKLSNESTTSGASSRTLHSPASSVDSSDHFAQAQAQAQHSYSQPRKVVTLPTSAVLTSQRQPSSGAGFKLPPISNWFQGGARG
ncbi:hypothetical protein E3Q24_04020 [Wallemia mellicola]|nr:hypothetical protein E3Q24_04020 [Wallemia mellicola]